MNKHSKQLKKKPVEKVTVSTTQTDRRLNLLANIEQGVGRASQEGPDIKYVVGSEKFGYIEYLILDANMPNVRRRETKKAK